MENDLYNRFSIVCGELCNQLYIKGYNKTKVNVLIDELNAKPYKAELFVRKHDAATLFTALCLNIKPNDESLAAKTSHLIKSIVTKQDIQFGNNYMQKIISWHIDCLKKCSDFILLDILHNLQYILQFNSESGYELIEELIGCQGVLLNFINTERAFDQAVNTLEVYLTTLKCITCLLSNVEEGKSTKAENPMALEVKENISLIVTNLLFKDFVKSNDEFLYSKVIVAALHVLCQIYFNDPNINIPLPEVMGICHHFMLYGLVSLGSKPKKIMPAQQTIAVEITNKLPAQNTKGGKKQKQRKQRNNAIESLKKEIPVSDCSLMKDVDNFDNSTYKPVSGNFMEPQKQKNGWVLTSDSDMSDVENSREAKLVALKSRVRLSASNLLLVLIKIKDKKHIFGYWWALLPDSPDPINWSSEATSKKTIAYCAVTDPIASSRASALSVILALLSGSKIYLSQAESSKKDNASFIPFSVSLGYIITCMHKVLTSILDSERSHVVIIVALKCCAALVQATPYHRMKEGLISEVVRSTRKYLVHRNITLQVGALITMGCVLSVQPKVDEILIAIEKDELIKLEPQINNPKIDPEDCDDFEEGYSDDELFDSAEQNTTSKTIEEKRVSVFKSWILDICFRNMGWLFRGDEVVRCKPSVIPIILESLQVLSAIAFHHLVDLLQSHIALLGDVLCEMLQHEHQDVILQSAKTVSIVADAIEKLEQRSQSPPLNECVHMWMRVVPPLSSVLQSGAHECGQVAACDCLANVGERSLRELPRRVRLLCVTLLMGSCGAPRAPVRAAAVRALAMLVMHRTLREDIGFVSDCGENILRALAEPTLVVRTKAAWALGNLSDALVLNMEDPEMDDIDDDLLLRLLEASIQCALDNDKVKMSATRGLGNLLRLIKNEHLLRKPQMKTLCETAIGKLVDCACKVTNMKVRWNACYALGNAMKNDQLFTCFTGWQGVVFPSLCALVQDCKNLKVRITAAGALRGARLRSQFAAQLAGVVRAVLAALEAASRVDDCTEYSHKDNLIEQLCVTLAHLCCLLTPSDLADILDPLIFYSDCAKSLLMQVCRKLPPENSSCLMILQAVKHLTVDLTASNDTQMQALSILQDIFIWDM